MSLVRPTLVPPALALAACLLTVAACGPSSSSPGAPTSGPSGAPSADPPIAGAPVARSVEQDGIVLTLRMDADRARAGDPVRVLATVTNTRGGIVFWQGGGCDLLQNLALDGPQPAVEPAGDPPQGADPAAVAGLIRWSALAGAAGGSMGFVPANQPPDAGFGCTSDLRVNELRPGETARVDAVWHGVMADGLPAPAGSYHVRLSFPFLARQAAGPFDGDPSAGVQPIALDAGFEVVGEAWTGLTAAQALDRALADARVQAWIADSVPRTQVGGASVRLVDGAWRLQIDVMAPDGLTTTQATIRVHPTSGAVEAVALP